MISKDDGNCHDALAAMYLFLDREQLDDTQRADVQAHLDECIPCLEAFEFETELKQVIAKRCKDDMPAHLYEQVRMRLHVEVDTGDASGRIPPAGGIPED